MRPLVIALPFAVTLAMSACVQFSGGARDALRPPDAGAAAESAGRPTGRGAGQAGGGLADTSIDAVSPDRRGEPSGLRGIEDLVVPLPGPDGSTPAGLGQGADGGAELLEGDPVLREQVAERCASRPANITEESLLRNLVVDLDTAGVDPSLVADALILGQCGDLADIVTEVVAQGGEPAAMPVIQRAIALTGSGSALIVERAAAEGLLLAGRQRVAPPSAVPPSLVGPGGDYAMLYFPLGRELSAAPEGMSLTEVIGNAEPGYGIYTYILGSGDRAGGRNEETDVYQGADAARIAAYGELLRVIETYVQATGPGAGEPDRGAHTFLVPVHAGRGGASLAERTGPEVSATMRRELAGYLRRSGQPAVAARLESAPGPFLVSSLEPRLVPGSPRAVRLIVDLSGIGPEYMYSIVDAYDREIPPKLAGRVESLLAVRQRLTGLFSGGKIEGGAQPPAGDWVFLFGRQASTQADDRPEGVRVAATDHRR